VILARHVLEQDMRAALERKGPSLGTVNARQTAFARRGTHEAVVASGSTFAPGPGYNVHQTAKQLVDLRQQS